MPSWSQALPALVVAVALCLLLVGAVSATPSADAEKAPLSETETPTFQETADVLESNTTITIALNASGDAHWRVETTVPLPTEEAVEGFEDVATEFEAGAGPDLGLSSYERAASVTDDAFDRDIEMHDSQRLTSIDDEAENRTGTFAIEFTWTSFARVDGNTLYVDDVFEVDGEQWLPGITADQRLVIQLPEGYGVRSAPVSPVDGELIWDGPADFTEEPLRATFVGNTGTDANGDDTDTVPPGNGDDGLLPWLFLVVALVVAGAFAYAARDNIREQFARTLEKGEETDDEEVEQVADGHDRPSEAAATPAESDDETDVELLSDEERIEYLLEENGGRMKQADIVKETDWSNAKVSQLLSGMHDDGRIDKLRIGRENLISFPDEDVTQIEETRENYTDGRKS